MMDAILLFGMGTSSPSFPVYHAALLDYVLSSGEPGLAHAYELGRTAFEAGCGLLHIVQVHEKAVNAILEPTPAGDELRRRMNASARFLIEALSIFEMACHGYRGLLRVPGDAHRRRPSLRGIPSNHE